MALAQTVLCEALSEDIGSVRLTEVEVPEPGPGEVRIRLKACAVNFPDLLMIQGKYQFKPPLPFAPGGEAAGDVEAVGSGVEGFREGDAVVTGIRYGGFCERANVPASAVRLKPERLSYAKAASYQTAYLTAYVALVRRGADHVLNYTLADGRLGGFREAVKALTDGRGADVIYDPVGGDVFDESMRCINWDGRILTIGFTSGRWPQAPVNLILIKHIAVIGVRAGEYGRRNPEKGQANTEAIYQMAGSGEIDPYVCRGFPLEQAVDAMRLLENREVVGKTVVTMNGYSM